MLDIRESLGSANKLADARAAVAHCHVNTGDYAIGMQLYTVALDEARAAGDYELSLVIEALMANGLVNNGEFRAAVYRLDKLLPALLAANLLEQAAGSLLDLAEAHFGLGDFSRAEQRAGEALALVNDHALRPSLRGPALAAIGHAQRAQGTGGALAHYERALDVARESGDVAAIGGALHNLGIAALEAGA